MRILVKSTIAGCVLFAALAASAQTSGATTPGATAPATPTAQESDFAAKHPRIHEVNQRLRKERARIQGDLNAGKITPKEAHRLLAEARQIHKQELRDVMKNDGHLTKEEQEHLNREETRLAEQLKKEEHEQSAPAHKK